MGPPGMGGPPPGMPPMPGMGGPPPGPPMPEPEEPPVPTSRELRQARRLKDYDLPNLKAPTKPTKEKILAIKEQRVEYWEGRNEEIEKDLAIYFLEGAVEVKQTGKGGEEVIRRITGRAMVDKVANMVDRQADRIQCTPRSQSQEYSGGGPGCGGLADRHAARDAHARRHADEPGRRAHRGLARRRLRLDRQPHLPRPRQASAHAERELRPAPLLPRRGRPRRGRPTVGHDLHRNDGQGHVCRRQPAVARPRPAENAWTTTPRSRSSGGRTAGTRSCSSTASG